MSVYVKALIYVVLFIAFLYGLIWAVSYMYSWGYYYGCKESGNFSHRICMERADAYKYWRL